MNLLLLFISLLNINGLEPTKPLVDGDWIVIGKGNVLEVINSSAIGFDLTNPVIDEENKISFKVDGQWGDKEIVITPAKNNQSKPQKAKVNKTGYTLMIDIDGQKKTMQLEKVVKKIFEKSVLSIKYKSVLDKYPYITIVGESPSYFIVRFPEPSEGILYMGATKD